MSAAAKKALLPTTTATESSTLLASTSGQREIPAQSSALDVFRLVAAVHIFYFHAGPRVFSFLTRAPDCGPSCRSPMDYGDTWVPFFFLLAGFGPNHARLVAARGKAGSEGAASAASAESALLPQPRVLLRRLAAAYPTYLVGLILSLIADRMLAAAGPNGARREPVSAGGVDVPTFILELLLLQGFTAPWLNEITYNSPGWFISALVPMWLLENAFGRLAKLGASSASALAIALFATVMWAIFWPFCHVPLLTYVFHGWDELPMALALQFLEIYFLGALLAHVLHGRAASGSRPVPFAATAGLVLFLTLILAMPYEWAFPLQPLANWMYNGLTSPFLPAQLLLITGLVEGADPLAAALNKLPTFAGICRELSLGVYLLQWPFLLFASLTAPIGEVGDAAPGWFMRAGRGDGAERVFVVFLGLLLLLALSAVVAYGLQRPAVALVKRWTASAVK